MFLVYILLLICLFAVVVPFVRWLVSRLCCQRRIQRLCRQKGYTLRPRSRFWFWGSRRSTACDCAIETNNAVYAVKLFGVPQRHATLVLCDQSKYRIRRLLPLQLRVRFVFDTTPEPFPAYNFFACCEDIPPHKELRPVLLVHPKPLSIQQQNQELQCQDFCYNDRFCGMEIVSLHDLLRMLA